MAVNIGPRIGIEGEAEYRKAIQGIIQETKTLKSEFEKIASDSGMGALKKAAEQSKVLTQEIEAQQKRVRELQKGYEEATAKWGLDDTKTQKWKQAVNEATSELNKLKRMLKDIPNTVEIIGQKFQDWGKKLQGVGNELKNVGYAIAPVSAAAAAGLTASAKSFMDFEAGMSNVLAISGANEKEFEQLGEKAKEMGAKTKFSAVESADAFSYMAMAGWKANDMLDGIEGIMNLAAASNEDLAMTSDIVTDAITAFGLSAKDASQFADVMAAAAANSNTNVAMLGESFKYIAPVAGSMNYSIKDTAIALGLMANAGIKSSMSGRALRNVLTNMANPSDKMAAAMYDLGVNLYDTDGHMLTLKELMDSLRASFGEVTTNTEDFQAAIQTLNEDYEQGIYTEEEYNDQLYDLAFNLLKVADAEKAQLAANLAGKQGMAGLLAIVSTSDEEYRKLTEAIYESEGAAQKMADTMLENAQGSWVKAKSALEGAAIEAGEVLAPYIIKAADAVKELANWFSNLSQPQQDMIVKTAAIVAGIGPLLIGAGQLISSVGTILSTGGKLVSGIGKVTKVAGGIGPIVTKIGSVISGVIPAISSALAGVGTFITGTLIPAIGSAAAAVGSAIAAALPVIAVIAAIVGAGVLLYKNWDTIKEKAHELGQTISRKWDELKENTRRAWEIIKTSISDAIGRAKESVSEKVDAIKTWVSDKWAQIKDNTSEVWGNIKDTVSDLISNAKDAVSDATENIRNAIRDKWEEVKEKTSETWNNVKDTVSDLITKAKGTVSDITENIKTTVSEKWESIKESTSEAWNNVKDTVSELIEKARETVSDTVEKIRTGVSEAWDRIKERTREIWENVKNSIKDGIEAAKNFVHDGIEGIKDKFHSIIDNAKNWGKDLIDNFIGGLREKWESFKDTISGIADTVKSFLGFSEPEKGPLSNFHTYAPDMMALFAKGIKDNTHLVTDQLSKSFDFSGTIEMGYGYIPDSSVTNNNSVRVGDTVINVYGAPGQDMNELADIIDDKINAKYANVRAAWA